MFWFLVFLTACSVTVGEEGREAIPGKHLRCSQTLSSPHSPYKSLPTISENSNVDDPKHAPSLTQKNGAPSPDPKLEKGSSSGQTSSLPKVQRSVSFGNERVRPKVATLGDRQSIASPPSSPHTSAPPAVMDILLPVLKVESCESDTMQQR